MDVWGDVAARWQYLLPHHRRLGSAVSGNERAAQYFAVIAPSEGQVGVSNDGHCEMLTLVPMSG